MTKDSSAVICPVAFGSQRCHGNDVRLHSHLGEGFAGDWGINKSHHMLFGQRSMWVTDCYAIRFILSYDGNNPAILSLQMRLMCWDVDIVHQNDSHLTNANYWSWLGANFYFDPLFKSYLDFDWGLSKRFPVQHTLPMKSENMPYYRGPQIMSPMMDAPSSKLLDDGDGAAKMADHSHCQSLFTATGDPHCHGLCHLANALVHFRDFDKVTPMDAHKPSNHKIPGYAIRVLWFSWAVYSFGGGHFISTIFSCNLPFNVTLACDNYEYGRALFREFMPCPHLFSSRNEMLHHIRASGNTSQVQGYLFIFCILRTARLHLHSGSFNHLSLYSCKLCTISNWLWPLSSPTTTVAASKPQAAAEVGWLVHLKIQWCVLSNPWQHHHRTVQYFIGIHSSCTSCIKPLS